MTKLSGMSVLATANLLDDVRLYAYDPHEVLPINRSKAVLISSLRGIVNGFAILSGELGVVDATYPWLNAKRYGAVANGVADDTVALQTMLTNMGVLYPKGGVCVIPTGFYKTTAPLVPPGRNALMDSSKHTIIMEGAIIYSYDVTAGRAAFNLNAFINTDGALTIRGGAIDGLNAVSGNDGVNIHSGNVKLDRVVIRNFTGGFGVTYTNDLAAPPICTEIASCYIQNNRRGVNATVAASLLYIHGGRIEHNKEENIYLDNCGKICFIGVTVENPGDGVGMSAKNNVYIRNAVDGLINGCYFESTGGQVHTSMALEGITLSVFALAIIGNRFVGTGGIGLDIGSTAGAVEGVVAHANYYSSQGTGVRLGTNARGCSVGPDFFSDNFDSAPAAWSAVTAYTPGSAVSSGGINYVCVLAHTNQVPPNATYWNVCKRYDIVSVLGNIVNDINRYAQAIYGGSSVFQLLRALNVQLSGVGTAGAGRLFLSATIGVCMQALTGTNFDWSLLTPGAAAILQNPTGTPDLVGAGHYKVGVAGKGLFVKEGANAKQGTAVLVAGTLVVANTSITASSRILLTSQVDGGAPGFLRVSARVVGTSFTILSSSGTDTSTVAWEIFEPA